jgi:vacuolar protein sorting-associated protein 35
MCGTWLTHWKNTISLFLTSCRKVFVFIQNTIAMLAKGNPEIGVKLYLEAALTADRFATGDNKDDQTVFGPIAYEFISQSFVLYEEHSGDSKLQSRCIVSMVGTLLACRSLSKEDYESLIMKTAQYAAKMLKKSDQCEMVALCSQLFYVVGEGVSILLSSRRGCMEILYTHRLPFSFPSF